MKSNSSYPILAKEGWGIIGAAIFITLLVWWLIGGFISFIFFPSQTKKAAQPLTGHTAFAALIVNDFRPSRKCKFPQKTTCFRFLLRQA